MPNAVVELLKAARQRQRDRRLAFGQGYGSGEEHVTSDGGTASICMRSVPPVGLEPFGVVLVRGPKPS